MNSVWNRVRHSALKAGLSLTQGRHYRRLIAASKSPRDAQADLLSRILEANAGTEFGKRHGFSTIKDVEDYRRAVPAQTYEDLRPLIERQELTGEKCLTVEQPVYYHRTSGTVGEPKNIPVTASGLGRIRRQQKISAIAQSTGSDIFQGKIFAITGQAVEGEMAGGTPFGSASGLLYRSQSKLVRSRYILPSEFSAIDDYESRYLAMAIYGLAEPATTCIATANPSTLVRLLSVINHNVEPILDAIATARMPDVGPGIMELESGLTPNRHRANFLRDQFEAAGKLTYADFWPDLKGIVTWTGGSCGVPLQALSGLLPDRCRIIELGYVASEVRGTINVDARDNRCLPALLDTFFEFVECDAFEGGGGDFQSLHELDEGQEYYVFVTTADGLYRYDMNDIVRATGRLNQTPTLAFVQKGKGVTNITGEKLHEAQVLAAVMSALSERGIEPVFFVMLADQETAGYTLHVETGSARDDRASGLSGELDRRLRASNIEYDGKRASGRLAPLDVRWLGGGAGDRYRLHRVAAGQRDAQFKYLHLQYAHECSFDFDAFVEPG